MPPKKSIARQSKIVIFPLAELKKNTTKAIIRVKVARVYDVVPFAITPASLDFILVDRDGYRIHATALSDFDEWKNKIVEHGVYYIQHFSVVDKMKIRPVVDNPLRIIFNKKTVVLNGNTSDVFPAPIYKWMDYSVIRSTTPSESLPNFDVIGRVVDVFDNKLFDSRPMLKLLLRDNSGLVINCVLWEPYCHQLPGIKYELDRPNAKPLVLIVQGAKFNQFSTDAPGISNTYNVTKLIFNSNCDEIVEFKRSLNADELSWSYSGTSNSSGIARLTPREELQREGVKVFDMKTITSFKQVARMWTIAEVNDVDRPNHGWCYIGCPNCSKKVMESNGEYHCESHGLVVPSRRYRFMLHVSDSEACADFLIWSQAASSLLKDTADSAYAKMKNSNSNGKQILDLTGPGVHVVGMPNEILDLVGKKFLFKVNIKNDNVDGRKKDVEVIDVCRDNELINLHTKVEAVEDDYVDLADFVNAEGVEDISWVRQIKQEKDDADALNTPPYNNGKRKLCETEFVNGQLDFDGAASVNSKTKATDVGCEEDEFADLEDKDGFSQDSE